MSETNTTASVQDTVEYIKEKDYIKGHEWGSSGRLILSYPEEQIRSHAGNHHIWEMREKLGYKIQNVNFRDNKIEWVSAH